jgi:hypothetical protein
MKCDHSIIMPRIIERIKHYSEMIKTADGEFKQILREDINSERKWLKRMGFDHDVKCLDKGYRWFETL